MNILVTANDPAATQVLRRLLARRHGHTVIEVTTGLQVVDALERRSIHALIVEVQLPVLGGIEVLRLIRDTPKYADLPVIVLASSADEQMVNELRSLDTFGVVLQTLTPERLASKLEPLLTALLAGTVKPARTRTTRTERRLHESSTLVFADGDPEFVRHFRGVAGQYLKLIEASTGVQALELYLSRHPDAMILGSDLGLLNRERVAAKLRSSHELAIPLIALCAKSEVDSTRQSGLFDDVIVRRYSPGKLQREIVGLVRPMSALDLFSQSIPDFRMHLIRAVEQTFGVMLSVDVELAGDAATVPAAEAAASVEISAGSFAVTVRFQFEKAAGRILAAVFLGMEESELGDEEIFSVFGEVVNVVAGRLRAAFEERGVAAAIGLPQIESDLGADSATADVRAVFFPFKASDRPVTFDVRVTARALAAAAGDTRTEEGVLAIRSDA